jgi:hypothetical protein
MARFDPDTYPDRLAFEAHARQIRAEELARELHAAGAWLQRQEHALAGAIARLAAVTHLHSHRHSPR